MNNTIRVVRKGVRTQIFLPNGQELKGVVDAKVEIGRDSLGTLTLALTDFTIDSSIGPRLPAESELRKFGLTTADYRS